MTSTEVEDGQDGDDDTAREAIGTTRRQWLIRILVGLGLGVPIAIEGVTFIGLIRTRLFGGEGDGGDGGDGGTATTTPTPTETPRPTVPPGGVGVGDELLPGTPQVDRVTEAVLIPDGETWTFSMTVQVQNTGNGRYELLLGSVETADGQRIPGNNPSTGQIEPGTRGSVTGVWEVPAEAEIATIQPVAVRFFESSGTTKTVAPTVPVGDVPVRDDTTTG